MWIYDFNSISIVLNQYPKRVKKLLLVKGKPSSRLEYLEHLAKSKNVLTSWIQKDETTKYLPHTANKSTRFLAKIETKPLATKLDLKDKEKSLILVLDQITDSRNFGAIIRSASAFGVDSIVIQKLKSPPITPEVYNTSAGTIELINLVVVTNIAHTVDTLKKKGYWIYGYDINGDKTIYDTDFSDKSVFILGSEQLGMRELVKKSCDFLVKIPMQNNVDSLNVSVSAGIAIFEFMRQTQK